ncbi:hypothetical protein MJG53_004229 [Ovis ammon polii x Ovis aries]|uniref:Uncharacterized protein n=1 Tax=Ovis ammon polii x Ovis aries TaxID=2918886 RepID=A0ACB9V975_9CETA|nr:hypothetical protein MJG53_004229 [Ovis ammon polii x Ovis aries]
MSFHKEDGVSSLCQKALHIVTELCFAGQVEWEKCSSIFPPDGGNQGGSNTAPGDFQCGLFRFCLLTSICPDSSTSLVRFVPAAAVSRS